jgi:hypothetical protein
MPLVRIDLIQGKSSDYRGAIGEVIYEAMLAIFGEAQYVTAPK